MNAQAAMPRSRTTFPQTMTFRRNSSPATRATAPRTTVSATPASMRRVKARRRPSRPTRRTPTPWSLHSLILSRTEVLVTSSDRLVGPTETQPRHRPRRGGQGRPTTPLRARRHFQPLWASARPRGSQTFRPRWNRPRSSDSANHRPGARAAVYDARKRSQVDHADADTISDASISSR